MVSGGPDYSIHTITTGSDSEQLKISVSDSDSSGTFTQGVKSWLLFNDGPNTVRVNEDSAATTNHFPVPNKSWIFVDVPTLAIHAVCAAGESATVYVWGVF